MSVKRRWWAALAVATTTMTLIAPALAKADYSASGVANKAPWSGYWWPMLSTDATLYEQGGALQKYDQYVVATRGSEAVSAQQYEQQHYSTSDPANSWWGHCHAWAAASILTGEPSDTPVTKAGITFTPDDLRGLITALYYSPKFAWLAGTRYDKPTIDENDPAYKDIAPAWMDYLLQYYIGYYHYPFIMDINADAEVWNFPAYAYTRTVTNNADGSQSVDTVVQYADPTYGTTGTSYFTREYTYTLTPGTLGTWTGSSVDNHPDFAWLPQGRNTLPDLDGSIVSEIEGENV